MKLRRYHEKTYALLGTILGLGAPLGALAWRLLWTSEGPLWQRLTQEWIHSSYFYTYMTVSTMIAFTLFGYVLGKKSDALERENRAFNVQAITDGLTNLYNHRYLHQHLSAESARARRYKTPLTCLMLDIDNFKTVNDAYGHPYGDEVLKVIARIIREQIRRVDTAGRYGGEEFLIMMPQTASLDALPVAERIRGEVQEYPFRYEGRDVHVTLSIGMATYDSKDKRLSQKADLLKAADVALYRAKTRGKNRTQAWSEMADVEPASD